MFLSWCRGMARFMAPRFPEGRTTQQRPASRHRRRMVLELLENRITPTTISLSLPTSGFSAQGDIGTVMSFPITTSSALSSGLGSAQIELTFPTSVFGFPIGNQDDRVERRKNR